MTAPTSITCPDCGMTSHNPHDVEAGYCGNCHWWTSHPILGPFRATYVELEHVDESQLRVKVREALYAKNMDRFTAISGAMGLLRREEQHERIAREELAAAPDDVHVYWEGGACNCTGVLN